MTVAMTGLVNTMETCYNLVTVGMIGFDGEG